MDPQIDSPADRVVYSAALFKLYENCDLRRLDELVIGDETWLCYFEPLRKAVKKDWVPKGGDVPQSARRCRPEKKVLYTTFLDSKGIVLQKPRKAGNTITGEYYRGCVLSKMSKYYQKKKLDQTCVGSNLFMVMHLYTSHGWNESILTKKTFKLCNTLPASRILHHVIFLLLCCFPRLQKRLSGRKFNSCLALGSAVFQCLDHIPREDCKHAFEQWIQGLKKCITAKGAHFEKKMQAKNLFEWVKGTLNRWSHLFPKYLRTVNFHYVCCPCMNLKSGFHYFIRQHFFVCVCWLLSWVVRRVQSSRK